MKKIFFTLSLVVLFSNVGSAQGDLQWKFKTDGRVYSTPIIEGDKIYFGSGDSTFYAVNKENGEEVWSFETEGPIHSSPTIVNELIYFASFDGNLYALNKTSGKLAWKFESEGEKMYDLWDYYLSSPRGDAEAIYWGSADGNLYAVESTSGKLKWKFETEDVIHATPVIYNENIYIGGFDGNFYCIQKDNGSLVWKFRTVGATFFPKGEIQRGALVKNDAVYFGSRDYNIYVLDANTGRGKWNMKQPRGWIIATPIEYKGNIYFGTSDAHKFYSLENNRGAVNWTVELNMRVYGTAVAHDDIIYYGTFDGKLQGVDYETGELKWEYQTEKSKHNYSTIYNEEGKFKEGFELYSEEFQKSEAMIHELGSILSSPIIDNEIIYFGSSDGNMYAISLK